MAKTAAEIRKDFDTRTESLEYVLQWHRRFTLRFLEETQNVNIPPSVRAQIDKQAHFHAAAVTVLERTIEDRKIFGAALDMGRIPKIDELDHETLEQIKQLREGETSGTG